MAAQASQVATAEQSAPTPLERALIEHVCSVVPAGGAPEGDRYLACLRTQLLSLRTDFGQDLSRLSAADRKALDAACNDVRTASGRDAYLDCLGSQLTILRSKQPHGTATPVMPLPVNNAAAGAPTPTAPPVPSETRSAGVVIGAGALLVLAVAGAGGLLFMRTRRASLKCRVCGVLVEASGDLCQACRHEAAEAVRRAAADRAGALRLLELDQRRQKDVTARDEDDRRRKALEEAAARRRLQLERQQEEARKREAEERRRNQDEAQQRRMALEGDAQFDPYAVLEISKSAGPDDIRTAYDLAREKSDPSQVAHLSDEVQEHFRAKAKAVERAFEMLVP
jgi:hypothetical protein